MSTKDFFTKGKEKRNYSRFWEWVAVMIMIPPFNMATIVFILLGALIVQDCDPKRKELKAQVFKTCLDKRSNSVADCERAAIKIAQ